MNQFQQSMGSNSTYWGHVLPAPHALLKLGPKRITWADKQKQGNMTWSNLKFATIEDFIRLALHHS